MLPLMLAIVTATDFTAPDHSFTITLPQGWHARQVQQLTILEPAAGANSSERILVGSGVSQARSIQELSQQAVGLTAQMFPGARLSAGPKFETSGALPMAEQEYQNMGFAGWNGMVLKGEFYFAILGISVQEKFGNMQKLCKEMLRTVKFQGVPRNAQAEAALVGVWSKSTYQSTRTGVRDKSNYSAEWNVNFLPGNRFVSLMQNFFYTQTETYGGGDVGSSSRATGVYRVFGNTLVADLDNGGGRQYFQLEWYPNGAGVKVNGQLFLRQ